MVRQIVKLGLLGLLIGSVLPPSAFAQYRGRDDNGNRDYRGGGDDREREEMRRRFEEMRSRYSSGGGDDRSRFGGGVPGGGFPGGGDFRGFDRGRGGDDNDRDRDRDDDRSRDSRSGDSRSGDSRGSSSKPRIQPYVPTPHTAISVDIPANYAAGDADGDRQIDLLEWRKWKPQEVANFMMLDANRDGFLTARELIIADKNPSMTANTGNTVASYPTSTQVPAGPDADGNSAQPAAGEKPSAAEARFVFGQLDKNANGKIDEEEWKGSKSIRGGFERAGIVLPLPADQATFFNLYPAQRIVPTLNLSR